MLCLVIDRSVLCGELDHAVEEAVAGGVDWVQVRERTLGGEALAELTLRVGASARRGAERRRAPVSLIVNRRADIALACAADGLHLGFDAVSPKVARDLLGPDARIGRSVHDPAEIDGEAALSYVHLAPIFSPLSKLSERKPLGLEGVRSASQRGVPVLAQGGVDASNAAAVVAAGAAGLAVTGAILMQQHPGEAAQALRRTLDA